MKHSTKAWLRAFAIWQKLGYLPWRKPAESKRRKRPRDFYKGAFDSIPFLNDDAKRTFTHLLLRPGYMIRDYIRGEHERYLAPLTALIIFYAFFALVSSVLKPVQKDKAFLTDEWIPSLETYDEFDRTRTYALITNMLNIFRDGYLILNLDRYPEQVDTQQESSLAALEGTLRSQGIPLFIGRFLFLWLAMGMALRRLKPGMAACAAASAYVLCQFSFFMLFAVLLSWGRSTSVNVLLMLVLLTFDYVQWLGVKRGKALKLALSTGIYYGLLLLLLVILLGGAVFALAYFKK